MRKTFKFRLLPSKKQVVTLESWLNVCRFLYNTCLEQRKVAYESCGVSLSKNEQMNQLPLLKEYVPEYKDVYSQVLQDVVKRADRSFENFFRRVKNGEEKAGYPRFKSEHRYNSFTFPQQRRVFSFGDDFVKMGKIGKVKVILHREIPVDCVIKTLTIYRDRCGDWWACCNVVLGDAPTKVPIEKMVGVDLGVSKLMVLSNGEFFENKKHIFQQEKRLKRLDRRLSRKNKRSKNRAKARLLRARAYRKLARQREDYLHKISRNLVENYDLIAFEDLHIKSMMKNHHLAKLIGDSSWGILTRFVAYKVEETGKTLMLVDPKGTSQQCSQCEGMVQKSLSIRTHECPLCGFKSDRDHNASLNILHRALDDIGQGLSEFTPVEIGVETKDLINISHCLNQSTKQEAIFSTS